jgi:hypothetical protein
MLWHKAMSIILFNTGLLSKGLQQLLWALHLVKKGTREMGLQQSWANDCVLVWSKQSYLAQRATSHTSQEPWPWTCERPQESVQKPSQHTSKIIWCGHGPSSVVWSRMWLILQSSVGSMNFYSCGPSHMIRWKKPTVVSVRSAMISRFLC